MKTNKPITMKTHHALCGLLSGLLLLAAVFVSISTPAHAGLIYVANYGSNTIEKIDSGTGADLGIFATVTKSDGLAIDTAGNLYATSFTVVTQSGKSLQVVSTRSLPAPV